MKSTGTRVAMLILGILMVILGVTMFATPGMNAIVLAYVMSAMMLVYGVAEIIYFVGHRAHHVSGWVLADGIITALLGLLLLCTDGTRIPTMTMLFAMWVLFTGVNRMSASFAAKDLGSHNWGWILAAGIIGTLCGIWLMCDPLLALVSIGYLLPAVFVVQGISGVCAFFSTGE